MSHSPQPLPRLCAAPGLFVWKAIHLPARPAVRYSHPRDQPVPHHRRDPPHQLHHDNARGALPTPGEWGEELLARAAAAALIRGASWTQIADRFGIPDPCTTPPLRLLRAALAGRDRRSQNARSQRDHTTGPAPNSH